LDRPESALARDYLAGTVRVARPADALLIVADATNLPRNLIFIAQALQRGLPAVIALNMIDLAQRRGLTIDIAEMSQYLGCPVIPICARSGEGLEQLLLAMREPVLSTAALPAPGDSAACARWANGVTAQSVGGDHAVGATADTFTDRLDAAFTHPVLGLLVFAAIMTGLFYTIFTLATVPMDLIELIFAKIGGVLGEVLPPGPIHDLLAKGVVSGIAGTLVFLPQICLLFFLISILEDTGYLARASFVMDRLLRRFGLPGQAFVPMLSAHACAIPAIMSTRLIPDVRDRLASVLVIPFLSCSARLPVYVLLISVLFGKQPFFAGLAFTACYLLGAIAALFTALLFRRTILRGPARPMVLELPTYKMPSLRTALFTTYDRAMTFLRKAGTVIVGISVVLWWLGAYPVTSPPQAAIQLREQARHICNPQYSEGDSTSVPASDQQAIHNPQPAAIPAEALLAQADALERQHAKANSFIGRIGHAVEPIFKPLGYDWQVSIGVLSSFMAREVFVSTMAVVLTGSDDDDAADNDTVRAQIVHAQRADGSPVFTTATATSLLVFYVLAMQCLPTLAVSRRETGSWKWPALQLTYMTSLAYGAAFLVHHGLNMMGIA
jgi:ferrous iron transport protein B